MPFPNLYAKIIFISFPSPPSPSELPFYISCSNSCDQGFPALLSVELMLTNVKATFALVIIILSARVLVMLPIRRVYTQARNFYETLIQIQIQIVKEDPNPNSRTRIQTQRSKIQGFVLKDPFVGASAPFSIGYVSKWVIS